MGIVKMKGVEHYGTDKYQYTNGRKFEKTV